MYSEWTTAVATVLQVVVLAIQSVLLLKTLSSTNKAVEISRKQLYAAQRPWISVTPNIVKFNIERSGVMVSLVFTTSNHGSSVANNVSVLAEAIAIRFNETRPGDALANLHKEQKGTINSIVMPNQSSMQRVAFRIDRTSIENAKDKGKSGFAVCVYGFAEYTSSVDNLKHYTDFSFVLGKRAGDYIKVIDDVDGEIDPDTLQLVTTDLGTTAI